MKTRPLALHLLAAGVIHAAQPNIVFGVFDDMGWTQPQSYDANSALSTPHLDRLATQGADHRVCLLHVSTCRDQNIGLPTYSVTCNRQTPLKLTPLGSSPSIVGSDGSDLY